MKKIIITERQQKLLSSLRNKKTYKITKEQHTRVQRLLKEDMGSPELHQAVAQLIHDIYNTPSQAGLGDFWVRNGITWADINTYLTLNGLLITVGAGMYELAKCAKNRCFKTGMEAAAAVEDSLKVLVKKKGNYMKDGQPQIMKGDKRLEMEDSHDMNSIWPNNPDDERDAEIPKAVDPRLYKTIAMNSEIAILKNSTGSSYVFYYDELPEESFGDVARVELSDISNYVNNNINSLSVGIGMEGFNGDSQLIKVDDALRAELINLYDKSPAIVQALSQLSEMTSAGSAATGGSSGPFTGPLSLGTDDDGMETSIIKKTPVVAEGSFRKLSILNEGPVAGSSADGGSSGPYDANALPGIGRDGEFKKTKKSKAEVSTQYPEGDFVKNSGGNIDGGKQVKGKGSIISKSAMLESVINELGLGDWKVKTILMKISETESNPAQYAHIFKLITGTDMRSTKHPKEMIVLALKEMGKEDVDYLYNEMFPEGVKHDDDFRQ